MNVYQTVVLSANFGTIRPERSGSRTICSIRIFNCASSRTVERANIDILNQSECTLQTGNVWNWSFRIYTFVRESIHSCFLDSLGEGEDAKMHHTATV